MENTKALLNRPKRLDADVEVKPSGSSPESTNGVPSEVIGYQDGIYPARSSGKPCWISLNFVFLNQEGTQLSRELKPSDFVRAILIPDDLAIAIPTFNFREGVELPQLEEAVFNPKYVEKYYLLGYYFVRSREHEKQARELLLDWMDDVIQEAPRLLGRPDASIQRESVIPLIRRFADPCQRFGVR